MPSASAERASPALAREKPPGRRRSGPADQVPKGAVVDSGGRASVGAATFKQLASALAKMLGEEFDLATLAGHAVVLSHLLDQAGRTETHRCQSPGVHGGFQAITLKGWKHRGQVPVFGVQTYCLDSACRSKWSKPLGETVEDARAVASLGRFKLSITRARKGPLPLATAGTEDST